MIADSTMVNAIAVGLGILLPTNAIQLSTSRASSGYPQYRLSHFSIPHPLITPVPPTRPG
jgi:hypothetical protein